MKVNWNGQDEEKINKGRRKEKQWRKKEHF